MGTEADTCRQFLLPRLYAAGWNDEQIKEQRTFTDGRIHIVGRSGKRRLGKRADYLLYLRRDLPLAVIEAKDAYHLPGDGLAQAKEYAQILDLPFAYSSNGHGLIEFDFLTGLERELEALPGPTELWNRVRVARGLTPAMEDRLLLPYRIGDRVPRYYQTNAIQRASEAILRGEKRVLLTLATGTGKTEIAFQLAWRLWESRWTVSGVQRRPKILFLADRSILVNDPKDKTFAPFGDARAKLEGGVAVKSRDLYFSTYQALAGDSSSPGLYTQYPPDFFDLILIDEAYRGSADERSSWRAILEHFSGAVQLGLTATPLRDDTRDTYAYFGEPVYTYSLRQGIADGFLAPYQVRRIVSDVDAAGWRPTPEMRDAYGREIPDRLYESADFERLVSLLPRTQAVARHLVAYLEKSDPYAKTLIFCEDQMHAEQMRAEIARLVPERMKAHPDYVVRVVADEGEVGKAHLAQFQELERATPVILTTSRLLSTGVDAPTVKNVVLFRRIGTMSEFKQIIGRGTRVNEAHGKLWFTILDFVGSATQKFADPEFDGEPEAVLESELPFDGSSPEALEAEPQDDAPGGRDSLKAYGSSLPQKLLVLGGVQVEIAHELVQELDAGGQVLRTVEYTAYSGEQVRSLYASADALKVGWLDPRERATIVGKLEDAGVSVEHLNVVMGGEDHDPLDLLCHLAYGAPLLTRKQRAEQVRRGQVALFDAHTGTARAILEDLLELYVEKQGEALHRADVFKVLPSSRHLRFPEVAQFFGGAEQLRQAVQALEGALHA